MKTNMTAVGVLCLVLAGRIAAPADASASLEPVAAEVPAALVSTGSSHNDGLPAACDPCPRTYGYAEALFLQRDNDSDSQRVIIRKEEGVPDTTVLWTTDLDFDPEPGLRILLGRRLCDGWALEGAYLGLFDSQASAFVAAPPQDPDDDPLALTLPGGLGFANVFQDMDRIWVDYSSVLHSGELNLVHCRGCCEPCGKGPKDSCSEKDSACRRSCGTREWFAGFRYLHLQETFQIYGERQQTTQGPTEIEQGTYSIRTHNDLYGAQVGARVRRWGPRLGWEAVGKAGLFGNGAQQEQYVLDWDEGGSFPRRPLISAASGQVAFVGELNLTGIYRLTDVWNLRAGYNLIWIAGVALAPDQLDFSGQVVGNPGPGSRLCSDGSVFLHGVNCGVEARW